MLQVAKHHLEQALTQAADPSAAVQSPLQRLAHRRFHLTPPMPALDTPSAAPAEVADHQIRQGRAGGELGGAHRTDKQHAHAHWLAAAAMEGASSRAAAFAWLGRYYEEEAGDAGKARRCYQRALAIDPVEDVAGEAAHSCSIVTDCCCILKCKTAYDKTF